MLTDAPTQPAAVALQGNGTALPVGPTGPAGPAGPAAGRPGRAGGSRGPIGPPAPLFLTLAQSQLRARAGKAVKVNFAATLAGRATLTASPGHKVVRRTLAKAGPGSFSAQA